MGELRRLSREVWSDLRSLPRPVRVLLGCVATYRTVSFVQYFIVLYGVHVGLSPAQAGLLLTVYGVVSVAGVGAGGHLIDRIGPRRAMGWTVMISGALVAVIPFMDSYGLLLAACAASGLSSQIYRPAASTLIAALTPRPLLVTASAGFRLAINLGTAVGPVLGAGLLAISYVLLFEVNFVMAIAVGVIVVAALPAGAQADRRPETRAGIVWVLRDLRYMMFVVAVFLTALMEIQLTSVLPLSLHGHGFPTFLYSALLTLNAILIIVFELPLTMYTKRWSMRVVVAAGFGLMGVGLGALSAGAVIPVLVLGIVVWTAGEMLCSPSLLAYPAVASDEERRAQYITVLWIFQSAGFAIGPLFGTSLFTMIGDAVWLVLCGLGLIAALLARVGVRRSEEIEMGGVR